MKRIFVAILAIFLMLATTAPAQAATGDNLSSFDASVTAGIPPCGSGVGTGIAYDGTSIILSCWGSNVLERVDAISHGNNGAVSIAGLPFGNDLNAMAWDGTRSKLWSCNGHGHVVLIDMTVAAVDVSQPAVAVAGCTDGLAYDGSDDTLWASPDVSSVVYHYDLAGNLLGSFSVGGLIGNCGNSGIAVGGPSLYLANNGCSEIYEVAKDGSASSFFANFLPYRLEDLECDGQTFEPLGAIWSQDAYDRILNAWEIPPDICGSGGIEPKCGDGNLDPGEECDDGNTNDGDGCSHDCKNENQPPDCSDAVASPSELWPPNHQFVDVSITGVTDPDGDAVVIIITDIAQDEPLNTVGDGNTCPDGDGVGTSTAMLRAERSGTPKVPGDGRVYHVSFAASDGNGGECTGTVTVCVPHDQRPDHTCTDQGPLYDSTICP